MHHHELLITPKAQILLSNFIGYTMNHLTFPLDHQEACGSRENGNFFCADWWTLEVAKLLLLGPDLYLKEPLPRRLQQQGFYPSSIVWCHDIKMQTFEILLKLKDEVSSLVIAEVGRGLELYLACLVRKDWEQIICYDNHPYGEYVNYFSNEFEAPIEFLKMSSNHPDKYEIINEKLKGNAIAIMTHSRSTKEEAFPSNNNPKIKHVIYNGELAR
jgi:hypothetical protein